MSETQTPEKIINQHRAEEISILARMQCRHKENKADEKRLNELAAIIATATALMPEEDNKAPDSDKASIED